MEEAEIFRKLSEKEMQEMLPDYVFNRIDTESRLLFEQNLPQYPEMQLEIRQVRDVFSKVEEMDIDSVIDAKTRNLSVRVQNKLKVKKKSYGYSWFMKYAVPTMGIIIIGVYTYLNRDNLMRNSTDKNKAIATAATETIPEIVTQADAAIIIGDSLNPDELEPLFSVSSNDDYSDLTAFAEDEDSPIDRIYQEQLTEQLGKAGQKELNSLYKEDNSSMENIYNELENLDESQIQSLIEDIKNVQIKS